MHQVAARAPSHKQSSARSSVHDPRQFRGRGICRKHSSRTRRTPVRTPTHRTPLPLYGSGSRLLRMLALNWPTASLS